MEHYRENTLIVILMLGFKSDDNINYVLQIDEFHSLKYSTQTDNLLLTHKDSKTITILNNRSLSFIKSLIFSINTEFKSEYFNTYNEKLMSNAKQSDEQFDINVLLTNSSYSKDFSRKIREHSLQIFNINENKVFKIQKQEQIGTKCYIVDLSYFTLLGEDKEYYMLDDFHWEILRNEVEIFSLPYNKYIKKIDKTLEFVKIKYKNTIFECLNLFNEHTHNSKPLV